MNIDLLIILRCSFHSFKKILCKTQSSHDVLFTLVSTITLFTYCTNFVSLEMIIGTFLIGNIVSFYDVILTLKLNHYLGLTVLN